MVKVIITALRRSGSTIFWKCFREVTKAICFDEPFNPKLAQLPREHEKKVYQEYINFLEIYREEFWQSFYPIYPLDELKSNLSSDHSLYLQKLLETQNDVVIDTTRCWNKIVSLKEVVGADTYLIHLHRSPASFVTSHLLPSDESGKGAFFRDLKRKNNFWTRIGDFNRWNMEDVMGSQLFSAFHLQILKNDSLAEKFYQSPAAYRLFKFWSIVFDKVEQDGRKFFGQQFISINFEDFCSNPTKVLQSAVSVQVGLDFDYDRLPKILPPKKAYMQGNIKWRQVSRYWNLPENDHFIFRNLLTNV
ncbi:hypothetical protein [Rivularia sp. UHCC 0363]|uniref:hypothetical protein n=1 Tax=Rivularia sp. UHCC 0363 TaxID=3110244 RepID=UPI002B215148|nr:hypothetical protein [Rivularia sp. UHCC 0363]MEA5596128.1 hypothetical protein [Rivularia sp. UHCC 0363]